MGDFNTKIVLIIAPMPALTPGYVAMWWVVERDIIGTKTLCLRNAATGAGAGTAQNCN